MVFAEMLYEVLSADFVQRTGSDARGDNAQFLRPGQDFLVLQAELFRDVVNANGHKSSSLPAGMSTQSSSLIPS
jgi:hypothetical protein